MRAQAIFHTDCTGMQAQLAGLAALVHLLNSTAQVTSLHVRAGQLPHGLHGHAGAAAGLAAQVHLLS